MSTRSQNGAVLPATAVYATTEDATGHRLVGLSVPEYGVSDPVLLPPGDWAAVHHIAHADTPATVPVLHAPHADPRDLASWSLPAQYGTSDWLDELADDASPESPEQARSSWHRLTVRAAFLHRRFDADNVRTDLLAEALRRAELLNWRSIATTRLRALARGDDTALPPEDVPR